MAWNSANIAYFQKAYGTQYAKPPDESLIKAGGFEVAPSYSTLYQLPKNKNMYVASQGYTIPRMDLSWFTNDFIANFNGFFATYTEYFARMLIRKFVETAAIYSPPNIGKANIDNKYYFRPIYKLEDLAKGLIRTEKGRVLHATREDYAALRAGFKFKVVNTKHGTKKGTAVAYTKGINEAKRASRIQNRGLTKYSWGSILNTFGEANLEGFNQPYSKNYGTAFGVPSIRDQSFGGVLSRRSLIETQLPPIFSRLQAKSPNIKKYRWGEVVWTENRVGKTGNWSTVGNNIKIGIKNNLAEVERYCQIAIRQGLRAVDKQTNNLVTYIQRGAKERIEKMFNFDIKRVTQITAFGIIKERKI